MSSFDLKFLLNKQVVVSKLRFQVYLSVNDKS